MIDSQRCEDASHSKALRAKSCAAGCFHFAKLWECARVLASLFTAECPILSRVPILRRTYDQCLAKRTWHQRGRFDHCIAAVPQYRFDLGEIHERRRKFGRNLEDLKRRQLLNEDKLNYELNIGARKFKCTTIPINQKKFGIVGAICINIDANYITDQGLQDRERIITWFQNFLRTDMQLDENILSKDEYAMALKGKRHFKDEAV